MHQKLLRLLRKRFKKLAGRQGCPICYSSLELEISKLLEKECRH
jgi:hypothetical protein